MHQKMIPAGYMYKNVVEKPIWLKAKNVRDIYSVSDCESEDFCDFINYWKHNGYWLFNSPTIMQEIASTENISISNCTLFYYEVYEYEYDDVKNVWSLFSPEPSFNTYVIIPFDKALCGYDVVNFFVRSSPECSPLSCNLIADSVKVNIHCLFNTFEETKKHLNMGTFKGCEPGPYRIFAVYKIA